jgi:hypothetical protein
MENFPEKRDVIMESAVARVSESFPLIKRELDEIFGEGFSKKHPDVFGDAVRAAATAYAGSLIAASIQESRRE